MADIIERMTSVFTVVMGIFTNVLNTIISEPLLVLPIILAILGGIIMFLIKKIRSLGVRAGGGRRRRR